MDNNETSLKLATVIIKYLKERPAYILLFGLFAMFILIIAVYAIFKSTNELIIVSVLFLLIFIISALIISRIEIPSSDKKITLSFDEEICNRIDTKRIKWDLDKCYFFSGFGVKRKRENIGLTYNEKERTVSILADNLLSKIKNNNVSIELHDSEGGTWSTPELLIDDVYRNTLIFKGDIHKYEKIANYD